MSVPVVSSMLETQRTSQRDVAKNAREIRGYHHRATATETDKECFWQQRGLGFDLEGRLYYLLLSQASGLN